MRAAVAARWARWRAEKAARAPLTDHLGRLHPALVFHELAAVVPDDAVIAVDVGNNAYSFGHFFECRGRQDVLMSGYLGSIGFALPAAIGASVAVRRQASGRKVVSISGCVKRLVLPAQLRFLGQGLDQRLPQLHAGRRQLQPALDLIQIRAFDRMQYVVGQGGQGRRPIRSASLFSRHAQTIGRQRP